MAKPGGTVDRGYGHDHRRLRKLWAPRVATGMVRCWRCGNLIDPTPLLTRTGKPWPSWHIGHDDHDRRIIRGPEHWDCNLISAAKRGYQAQQRTLNAMAIRRQRW